MELRHLRYFVATAETLNMRKAADALHVAQPALSVQIRDLEYQVGAPLFDRVKNRLRLTDAGTEFLKHARAILNDAAKAVSDTRLAAQGKVGELRIDFISSAVSGVLQNTIARYRKKYPDVRLVLRQLNSESILESLRNKQTDVGFIRTNVPDSIGLVTAVHYLDSYMVALPSHHPLAKRKTLSPKDLKDEPLIQYPRATAHSAYDEVTDLLTIDGVPPVTSLEAAEQTTIAALVAAGLGYSVVPNCMMNVKIAGVAHVPLQGGKNATGIGIVHRADAGAIVKGFVSTLKG